MRDLTSISSLRPDIVFVTPSPRTLRAGAVWVTIRNWVQAAQRLWGETLTMTPAGPLTDEELQQAAWGRTAESEQSQRYSRISAPALIETATKDVRSFWVAQRFDRSMRAVDLVKRPRLVWQHHDLFQIAGFSLARKNHCPLVLFVDAPQVWEAQHWGTRRPGWGRLVERLGESPQFRNADLIACVSEEVREAAIARGASAERAIVTPCTADSIRAATSQRSVRAELNLSGETVIGWVGSFRPFHRAEAVVRAVAALQTKHPVALLMVGAGPTRAGCQSLATSLGIRRAFFPGSVAHENVIDYLQAIDVAVIPSTRGFEFHYSPLKLKEFLASGRAVVAPTVGEFGRLLRGGIDSILYINGDDGAMVSAIEALLADPKLRSRIAIGGQATYDRLFSIDDQLKAVDAVLGLGETTASPNLD